MKIKQNMPNRKERKMPTFDEIKCKLHNGIAYMKDDTMVYNIMVYGVPKRVKLYHAFIHFKKFGEIRKVQLFADPHSAFQIGEIEFVDPFSAARALLNFDRHKLCKKHVIIEAADNWHEVYCSNIKLPNESSNNDLQKQPTKTIETQYHVMQLSIQCLDCICQHLNLEDQICFAQSCPRFEEAFKQYCKRVYKTMNMMCLEGMKLHTQHDFLQYAGEYIQELVIPRRLACQERLLAYIGLYCTNLKRLHMMKQKRRPGATFRYIAKMKNICELEFTDCTFNDNAIIHLQGLPKLETLIIKSNPNITGRHIGTFASLQKLELNNVNIKTKQFLNIVEDLTALKSLGIFHCDNLDTHVFKTMIGYCKNLEDLRIAFNHSLNLLPVVHLANLKQLDVCFLNSICDHLKLFNKLVEHKANQLESLKISDLDIIEEETCSLIMKLKQLKCLHLNFSETLTDPDLRKLSVLKHLEDLALESSCSITDSSLLHVINSCVNLKKLNITDCVNITTNFLSKATHILRQLKPIPRAKLVCYVSGTQLETDMLQTDEDMNNEYIQLSLENLFDDIGETNLTCYE